MKKTILLALLLSIIIIMGGYGQSVKKDSLTVQKVMSMPAAVKTEKILEQDSTIKDQKQEIKDCSAEVKHYADSIQELRKKHNSEVSLARQIWFWGEDKSNPGKPIDWFLYLLAEIVTLLAWFVSIYIIVSKAIKDNKAILLTKFNLRYWWTMNKMQIFEALAILIFIFFMCRLSNEYFSQSLNFLYAVALGAGLPQYIAIWKAKNQKKMDDYSKTLQIEKPV